ncbi:MAG: GAF domain-containing protein [Chloroflexi bacterium]|nr:GAF domain-containing protein [Chloroflexota bacterium]
MEAIALCARKLAGAEAALIATWADERGGLTVIAAHSLPQAVIGQRRKVGEGPLGLVARERQPIVTDTWPHGELIRPSAGQAAGSAAILPLFLEGEFLGVAALFCGTGDGFQGDEFWQCWKGSESLWRFSSPSKGSRLCPRKTARAAHTLCSKK